jgi:predicted nucleic acid-binding protein
MRSVLIDTGPLVALFDKSDVEHSRSLRFIQNQEIELITTTPVIGEVMALLRFSVETQLEFLKWVQEVLTVDVHLVNDLPRIREVMLKYADLPADFADASLVAAAERRGINTVASVDKDFSIYRTKDKKRFRNAF